MGTVTVLPETTRNPITLIGKRAGVCWGADTGDDEKNYKRGLDCINSGHGRTLEFVNVETILDGYSARVIREWYTHIGGAPTRLQESTRYVDSGSFGFVIPDSIRENNQAMARYVAVMDEIRGAVKMMEHILNIPREDAAMLLPLGMATRVVDKRNLRNLVDISRQRMCVRAYWEFRELFDDLLCALEEYSDEWQEVIEMTMHAKCYELGYCPEKHGCGKYKRRSE